MKRAKLAMNATWRPPLQTECGDEILVSDEGRNLASITNSYMGWRATVGNSSRYFETEHRAKRWAENEVGL